MQKIVLSGIALCGVMAASPQVALGDSLGRAALAESGSDEADLRARVAELEQRVRELSGDHWLTEERAKEIRAIVQDVLADADTRASLLQGGASAGHDGKKFFLADANGNFSMNIEGQLQVRWVLNLQDDNGAVDGDSTRYGFEVRRAKVKFAGHVVDPSWTYEIQGAFSRSDGDFHLEEALAAKEFDNGITITFGQFKFPFLREELISSKRQLAVDRSFVNELYNQDRSQGVQVSYEAEQFRLYGAIGDGFDTDNTSALALDTEFAITGRAEVKFGDATFKQFDDFTSWSGEPFGVLVGGAFHYEKEEYGTATLDDEIERVTWTFDAQAEFGGANAYAAIIGNHLDDDASLELDQIGFVIQGGLFVIEDELELFLRYEWSDIDVDPLDDINIVTFGVNKYFSKHQLKWTTDIGVALDSVFTGESGIGYREDINDEDSQVVIRSQFQLTF